MFEIAPVAWVTAERTEPKDDNWAGLSKIVLDESMPDEAFEGIEEFSHLHVIFYFHKADPAKMTRGKRHPRNNPNWPEVGVFASRGKNRPNQLGLTTVKLIKHEGREIIVEKLDAINGTPVIDIKPVERQFLPDGEIRQPQWVDELMRQYYA